MRYGRILCRKILLTLWACSCNAASQAHCSHYYHLCDYLLSIIIEEYRYPGCAGSCVLCFLSRYDWDETIKEEAIVPNGMQIDLYMPGCMLIIEVDGPTHYRHPLVSSVNYVFG